MAVLHSGVCVIVCVMCDQCVTSNVQCVCACMQWYQKRSRGGEEKKRRSYSEY